jgi:hypothetical protein
VSLSVKGGVIQQCLVNIVGSALLIIGRQQSDSYVCFGALLFVVEVLSVVNVNYSDREPLAKEVDDNEHHEEEDRVIDHRIEELERVECPSHQVRETEHHQVSDESVPGTLLEIIAIA